MPPSMDLISISPALSRSPARSALAAARRTLAMWREYTTQPARMPSTAAASIRAGRMMSSTRSVRWQSRYPLPQTHYPKSDSVKLHMDAEVDPVSLNFRADVLQVLEMEFGHDSQLSIHRLT